MAPQDDRETPPASARLGSGLTLAFLPPVVDGAPQEISCVFPTGHETQGYLVAVRDVSWWKLGEYELGDIPADVATFNDLANVYAHEFPDAIDIKLERPAYERLQLEDLYATDPPPAAYPSGLGSNTP